MLKTLLSVILLYLRILSIYPCKFTKIVNRLTNGHVSPSFHFSAILFDYTCNATFVKIDTL